MTNGAGLIPVRSSATINAKSFTACSSQPAVTQLDAVNLDFLSNKQLALPTEEVPNTKTTIGTPQVLATLTEATDLSGSKIMSTLLAARRSVKLHLVSRSSALLR